MDFEAYLAYFGIEIKFLSVIVFLAVNGNEFCSILGLILALI